jgi:TRAP-type transport system periplasmic protein
MMKKIAFVVALALAAPVAADEKTHPVLKLGTLAPEGTPWAETLEHFKQQLESATKGEMKVKLYLNGRQGDEPEMLKKLEAKELTGGGFTSSGLAAVVPELALVELPFLFEDDAEADYILDEVIRQDMAKRFEAKGLHLYIWAVNGWVDLASAKGPLATAADVKASKPYIREAGARRAFWTALGASPVVVPVPEVVSALRDGKVDAYDTTPLFATAARWYAETKHWTDSNHVYQPAAVVFDLAWWKSLPEGVRKQLEALAPELQSNARKNVRGLDAGLMEELRKQGLQVHGLAPAERAAMKKATEAIGAQLVEQGAFPKDLHDKVVKALADRRAAAAAKPVDPLAELIAQADKGAAARPNMADLNRAEFALQEALKKNPKSFDATWRMARMHYYLGHYGPEARKLAKYEAGIDWAKKAVALDPKRVEGHFWLGVMYGVFGETKGITSSLFLVDDMEESLKKAYDIDPAAEGGGAPRVLGRLFFKLPWAAGGSNEKSLKYLKEAVKLDPTMPWNYVYLAETLIDEDEEKDAKALLDKLAAMEPAPRWAQEHKEAAKEAEKLRKKL